MNVVSSQQDEMKNYLVNESGKGITVFKGEKNYLQGSFDLKTDCEIIDTIIARLEIKQIQNSLLKIDPKEFIYIESIEETRGIFKT